MAGGRSTTASALTLHLGRDELVIRRRYEALSIVNDILIGLWFTVGSFLFFSESTTTAGTWLFVIGSIELLLRPMIRMTRIVHLRRRSSGTVSEASAHGSDQDF